MKDKWKYVIRKVNPVDFELEFTFVVKNDLLIKVFNASRDKLAKKKGIEVKDVDIDKVGAFDVTENYFNLIKTFVRKPFKITSGEVRRLDRMNLVNYEVGRVWFVREESFWNIHILTKGSYMEVLN